jgi:hypothetical protein
MSRRLVRDSEQSMKLRRAGARQAPREGRAAVDHGSGCNRGLVVAVGAAMENRARRFAFGLRGPLGVGASATSSIGTGPPADRLRRLACFGLVIVFFLLVFSLCSRLAPMSEFEAGAMHASPTVGLPPAGRPPGRARRAGPPARAEGQQKETRRPFFCMPLRRLVAGKKCRRTRPPIAASLDRATRPPAKTLSDAPTCRSCPPSRTASLCRRTSWMTLDRRLEAERSAATEAKRQTSPRSPSRAQKRALALRDAALRAAPQGGA